MSDGVSLEDTALQPMIRLDNRSSTLCGRRLGGCGQHSAVHQSGESAVWHMAGRRQIKRFNVAKVATVAEVVAVAVRHFLPCGSFQYFRRLLCVGVRDHSLGFWAKGLRIFTKIEKAGERRRLQLQRFSSGDVRFE
jgi:hypothetical protein